MEAQQAQLGQLSEEPSGAAPDAIRVAPGPAHRELAGLTDGESIEGHYVVRDRSRRPTKKGGEWLAIKLSDRSGSAC